MSSLFRHYSASELELQSDVPGARYFGAALEHCMLTYFEVEPHTRFPEHRHASEQITLVLSGELFFEVAGEKILVGPGEIIALPANVAHAVSSRDLPTRAVDAWSPPRSFDGTQPADL